MKTPFPPTRLATRGASDFSEQRIHYTSSVGPLIFGKGITA